MTEEPGGLQSLGSLSRKRLSDFTFTFHFHALEKEMATHSSVLAWGVPGMEEPGGLPSMGSHRVGHDWSDLAAAATIWFNLSEKIQSNLWWQKVPHWLPGKGWVGLGMRSTIRGQRKHFGVMDNLHSLYCSCGLTCVHLCQNTSNCTLYTYVGYYMSLWPQEQFWNTNSCTWGNRQRIFCKTKSTKQIQSLQLSEWTTFCFKHSSNPNFTPLL